MMCIDHAIQQIITSASSDQRKMLISVIEEKTFCPTGPGGGVDPSCGGGGISSPEKVSLSIVNNAGSLGEKKKAVIENTVTDLSSRFPKFAKAVPFQQIHMTSGSPDPDVGGKIDRTSGIITLPVSGAADSPLKIGKNNFIVDKSLSGRLRHELGHSFQFKGGGSNHNIESGREWDSVAAQMKKTGEGVSISKYASTTREELFAESFSAYTHPKYEKGALPKVVESYFDKYLG